MATEDCSIPPATQRFMARTIVERPDWTGDAGTPAVSPDGRTVIYRRWNSWRSTPAGGQSMFIVDIDGSNHHRLTPWKLGGGDHPDFSPDGTILFRSNEQDESKQSDYWTVRPDGTGITRLTHFSSPRSCSQPPTRPTASGSSTAPTASRPTPTSL